jgi:arsenical pump membrane protein
VLLLLPAAAAAGPGVVLSVLIGVNAGPNLTYVGSLATLLWRRALRERGEQLAPAGDLYTRLPVLAANLTWRRRAGSR